MQDDEYQTTIGTGGWILVVLSGVVTFGVLRLFLDYDLFPEAVFGLAIALIVFVLLYRLAIAINRLDDEEEARRVRQIVPASAAGDSAARVSGVEGSATAAAMAVPVRPQSARPVPQRPSNAVKPLAEVEPAPLITPPAPPPPKPAAPTPPAPIAAPIAETPKFVAEEKVTEPKPKASPKPKAEAKPKAKADAKSKAEAKPKAEPKPKAEKPKATKAKAEPAGLVRLKAPRKGKADDLKELEGIGPALEKLVNSLGFYHFDQIAGWTEADVALVDAEMKTFKGRISRDRWVEQAKLIVSEGLEAFRERAKTNNY